jgi:hypothetical protein
MEILVNREPLDFTLEDEQSLGEVVDGLQAWLTTGQFTITSIDVNDTSYPIHNRKAWEQIEVKGVRRLSVEALPRTSADQNAILAVDDYLSLLQEALTSEDQEALTDLLGELPHVRERIIAFFPSLADSAGESSVLVSDQLDLGAVQESERIRLTTEITQLRSLLVARAREFAFPVREMAITLGQLSSASEELEQVPVQLQTGEGAQAMRTVISLTELLGRVFRLTPLVESAENRGDLDVVRIRTFTQETSEVLAELAQAFEINDTVLVGDLLEYELAPRMRTVSELVPDQDSR